MPRAAIDQDRLCRFVLLKQHLAETSRAARVELVSVVRDICGLHAQVATTPYLSLFNRIKGFQMRVRRLCWVALTARWASEKVSRDNAPRTTVD